MHVSYVLEALKIAKQFSSSRKTYSLYLEILGSDLGRNTHSTKLFLAFRRYVQVNARMVH
jgi:hypothetical protein